MPKNHSIHITATGRRALAGAQPQPQTLPPLIVAVTGNQAVIYSGYESHTLQLPACILEVAPIVEMAFPQWWESSQAERVRAIVFGLTRKNHIKGLHIIDPVRPVKRRRDNSIIRIVKPVTEGKAANE